MLASIPLAICLGLVTLGFHAKVKAWSHPAVAFSGFWFLMMALPILVAPQITLSPYAFGYVLLAVVAFGIPSLACAWGPHTTIAKARIEGPARNIFASRELFILFLALQTAPIVLILINLKMQGFHLSSLTDPLKLNCEYLSARYNGHITANIAMSSGTLANYVGAPIGGMLLAGRRKYAVSAFILFMSFVPGALNMIAYADKGTIFLTTAYFYGGVIVGRVARGSLALVTARTALGATVVAAFLVPLVAVAMVNRSVRSSCDSANRTGQVVEALTNAVAATQPAAPTSPAQETAVAPRPPAQEAPAVPSDQPTPTLPEKPATAVVKNQPRSELAFYLRSYAVGAQFAFSDWFENYMFEARSQPYASPSYTLGRYSFMFVAKRIDKQWAATVPDGYFGEYFKKEGVLQTNIYTFWRGLILDFGIPGSLLFMIALGIVMNLFYRRMLIDATSPFSQSAYVFFAGFTYSSSLISLLTWTSPVAAFFVLAAILFLFEWRVTSNVGKQREWKRSSSKCWPS